nr:hypothetical protein [Halorhodospira abdelmalekii]
MQATEVQERNDQTVCSAVLTKPTNYELQTDELQTAELKSEHEEHRTESSSPAALSVIHAVEPRRLSKSYRLDPEKGLVKESGGNLIRGNYKRIDICGPAELAELISQMEPRQALCFGVTAKPKAMIAARDCALEGEITRTRDHFDWPAGSGWLLLDYDPPENETPLTREELLEALIEVWPELKGAPAVVGSSGSAYIYNAETGEELVGAGGLRVYVQVADARDIRRAGQVLHERLWLAGRGYYNISKSGQYLDRSPVDTAVWQPERLDFAAGAHCVQPLEQRRPEPEVRNPTAAPIDTRRTLPDLNAEDRDRLESLQADLRYARREEQAQIRGAWIEERIQFFAEEGSDEQARERLMRVLDRWELPAEFKLFSHSMQDWVTVGEILKNRDQWHGERFADPLEPDYRGDTRIAWANLRGGGMPYIHSHAHGGQRFDLIGDLPSIRINPGEMPALIRVADQILTGAGAVYQRGGELVRILSREGHIQKVTHHWLKTHLEERAHWLRFDGRKQVWMVKDCPDELPKRVMHNRGAWGMPELTGIVRGPILRPDGSLLKTPGYDQYTGLLLLAEHPDGWPSIPEEPSPEQVRKALARLWEPFQHFPFVDDLSRSSRPGEPPPEALTEPYVNLSIHTALVIGPSSLCKAPASERRVSALLPGSVGAIQTRDASFVSDAYTCGVPSVRVAAQDGKGIAEAVQH